MIENLNYWNERAVNARNDCDNSETPVNCEELAFARCMVKIFECKVFNRKEVE